MPTIDHVLRRDMCSGCGGCSVATHGSIPITLGPTRSYQADAIGQSPSVRETASSVCPFTEESPGLDEVGTRLFAGQSHDPDIGYYDSLWTGRITDGSITGSSSGGLTNWIASQLLARGLVDGVIHVGKVAGDNRSELFEYRASYDEASLQANRKSVYYSVSYDKIVREIRGDGRRYAFIGVPCFITSLRNVCAVDPVLEGQIAYFIGLVCGHLKSQAFSELLAWQLGLPPDELKDVDFRVKDPDRSVSDYGFAATSASGNTNQAPVRDLVGAHWGHAMFQLNACNYCEDIFAEAGDVVLGDAWLPEFASEWRGTNIVLSRNAQISEILQAGARSNLVALDSITPRRLALSQGGNFRHRRDGLAVRLHDDMLENEWVPPRRSLSRLSNTSIRRRKLIRTRRAITAASPEAFARAVEAKDVAIFTEAMRPLLKRYRKLEVRSWPIRKVQGAFNLARRAFGRTS